MKRQTQENAHYVCGGCGRLFQTVLKLYGHEKSCRGRKSIGSLTADPLSQALSGQASDADTRERSRALTPPPYNSEWRTA
jgi:hypothetical protein